MFQQKTSTEYSKYSISFDVRLLLGVVIVFFSFFDTVVAQEKANNSSNTVSDTTAVTEDLISAPNMPRRALLYSAILPGLGQAYNGEYWKIPLAIGGFVTTGWMINLYNEEFIFAKEELFARLNDDNFEPRIFLSEEQLRRRIEIFRRDRDFMMVMTAVFYMLQIADAHIDAHLKEFDNIPDLEVSIQPSTESTAGGGSAVGMGLALKF